MRVDVYRNLHKDTWSIRDRNTGRVVEHSDNVKVTNASFVVQPAGRERVLREKHKNVHAFIRGDYEPSHWNSNVDPCYIQVKYNPYAYGHFYLVDTHDPVAHAPLVVLNVDGAWICDCPTRGYHPLHLRKREVQS